jgi:hypothetical protein
MTKNEMIKANKKLADMLTEKQQIKRVEREINKARRNKPLSIFR